MTVLSGQSMRGAYWGVVVCVIAIQGRGLEADDIVATKVTGLETGGSFSAQVQDILEVRDTGTDVLSALESAIKNTGGDAVARGTSIRKLVDAVLAGASPSTLTSQVLASVDLLDPFQERVPEWKWGTYNQRIGLIKSMWSLAESAAERDPRRAAEIARAALVFSALNDYQAGWAPVLTKVTRVADAESTKKLLGINDRQFERLKAVVKRRQDESRIESEESLVAERVIDRINESKGDIDAATVNEVLVHLDEAFRKGPAQEGYRWECIHDAWDLVNLARIRKSKETEDAVRKQLETWKKDYENPTLRRWISQALEKEGPAPGKKVADFVMLPSGKIVPKDSAEAKK
jgi:hypothetical protein